jgi:hypothetical protein
MHRPLDVPSSSFSQLPLHCLLLCVFSFFFHFNQLHNKQSDKLQACVVIINKVYTSPSMKKGGIRLSAVVLVLGSSCGVWALPKISEFEAPCSRRGDVHTAVESVRSSSYRAVSSSCLVHATAALPRAKCLAAQQCSWMQRLKGGALGSDAPPGAVEPGGIRSPVNADTNSGTGKTDAVSRGLKKSNATARKSSMVYPLIFGPLYFFSVAMAIPASPSLVNTIISGDNTVTSAGQMKLGSLLATDAMFTLLTTNMWATLSDKYGRKPFLALSAAGIGVGAGIVACSSSFAPMYAAAAIDGCTSCMFGLGQAYVCDVSEQPQLAANIGLFMGVSAGIGFTFGVPFSAVLMKKRGIRAPFVMSAGIPLLTL